MRRVLTAAEAVAYAVKAVKPGVISAYPITPQTHVIEKLAEFVETGELDADFVRVEAEISAISVVAGSVIQGVRAFTATSSHGLVYMHELLHWCAGGRLPIVMAVANRALGAPWNIWCDQQDMLSQRDTGWMQIFARNAQEAHDLIPVAYRVAERVFLPVMVGFDGFILSHTAEPVEVVEDLDGFLPPLDNPLMLSHHQPFTLWPILEPGVYHLQRKDLFEDHKRALEEWKRSLQAWKELSSREYGVVEAFYLDDAKSAFLCVGSIADTALEAVKLLRREGERVGLILLRLFRPFPSVDLAELVVDLERLMVLDRAVSWGAEGIVSQEVRNAVAGACPVQCCVVSMGGKDVFPEDIAELYYRGMGVPEGVVLWS